MTNAATEPSAVPARDAAWLPIILLATAVLIAALLLALPLTLPVGPMYWDLVVYLDGAERVLSGQVPSADFFAPIGPLSYWLVAALLPLFDNAQPLLLVQWSLLIVSAPPMFVVLGQAGASSRAVAFALLIPFLFFQLLPMNVEQFASYPGVDGFGIYNRHGAEMLYVLSAALLFVRSQRALFFCIAWCCLALFLVKITAFVAASIICLFAFLAGRVAFRTAVGCLLAFLGVLAVLQFASGAVLPYLGDILALVEMNEGALLPRFLQASSVHFGILLPAALLCLMLLLAEFAEVRRDLLVSRRRRSLSEVSLLLDREALWLGVVLFAGLFYETQNTGGQAFILIWPVLLWILLGAHRLEGARLVLVLSLVAAAALPPVVNILHRTARAMIGQLNYVEVPQTHLGRLGQVTQRPEFIERARLMRQAYIAHPEAYRFLADNKQLPSHTLYGEIDFQVGWLIAVDEAVGGILAYEAETGTRFASIMSLNFVNPFPFLMERDAPRLIAIGADPYRAVPPPNEATLAAVAATDLILYPTCPITNANQDLRALYALALDGRRTVGISPCWEGYVKQ